jgi:hypothetical protein
MIDELMAAEVARQEELELEGLIASYSQDQATIPSKDHDMEAMYQWPAASIQGIESQSETPYGSDDEEYDHIFMDVIEEESRIANQRHQFQNQQEQAPPGYLEDHEMMDMS